jgi:NAD(P)-dependent dehydrogenase (short-subunit alcohol dehydrogenase family)
VGRAAVTPSASPPKAPTSSLSTSATRSKSVPYDLAVPDDLAETVRQVEEVDRRIHAVQADVSDSAAIRAAVASGVKAIGPMGATIRADRWGQIT